MSSPRLDRDLVVGHCSTFVLRLVFTTTMTSLVVTETINVRQVNNWQPYEGDAMTSNHRLTQRQSSGELTLDTSPETSTDVMNETMLSAAEVERALHEHQLMMQKMSNFDSLTKAVLITLFVCLILFGVAGNGLVCYVVAANSHMRSPRNILILNLAVSDLILCCLTQPFNLTKVSIPTWNLGVVLCKLVPMMAGTNVFVSTITITAIALDRFHLIVHPTEKDLLTIRPGATALAIGLIWTLSVLASSPLLVFCSTESVEPIPGLHYEVCVESTDLHYVKASYSVISALCQYVLPILIVSVAHAQICGQLRARMNVNKPTIANHSTTTTSGYCTQVVSNTSVLIANDTPTPSVSHSQSTVSSPSCAHRITSRLEPPSGSRKSMASPSTTVSAPSSPCTIAPPTSVTFQVRKQRKEASRKRKTNRLLVAIAVIFAGSWLPLNAYNIIADFNQSWLMSLVDANRSATIIAVCHLLVLCSACANPVLYGWLNDNFRREFVAVLCPTRFAAARASIKCCRHFNTNPLVPSRGNVIIVCENSSIGRCSKNAPTSTSVSLKNRSSINGDDTSGRRCVLPRKRKDITNGRVVGRHRSLQRSSFTHSLHGYDASPRGEVIPLSKCSLSSSKHVLPVTNDQQEVLVSDRRDIPEVEKEFFVSDLVVSVDVTPVN